MFSTTSLRSIGLVLATESSEPEISTGGGVGMGAVVLTLAVAVLLTWMAYLYINSRRNRVAAQEAAPPNLSPHVSDEELENEKLTKVLRAALFGSILLAIVLPWYAINEPDRQATAAEMIAETDVHEGEHWYSIDGFQCVNCHGPAGVGGAAPFVEARSGVDVSWKAPSLNDIFYRYSEDEVRHWIVFGRAGTPMPANGLDGGGAMTVQEVDQVIAYLQSIQIPQDQVVAATESATSLAVDAIAAGADTTAAFIEDQEAEIELVKQAGAQLAVVGTFPDDIKDLMQAPDTCTEESAEAVGTTCANPASDGDRDGLSDVLEGRLTVMARTSSETLLGDAANNPVYTFTFNPANGFTNEDPDFRTPLPDLDAATTFLETIETEVLLLNVTNDRQDVFLDDLQAGLDFLLAAQAAELWDVDFDAVASEMGVSVDDAMEAAGLFNAYCARCHTGGYSAGTPFEQGAGSGAWGPSLLDGRAVIQFPDLGEHIDFIVNGSEDSQRYGINGLGSGRMPAFGQVLSERQIELIALYERTL